MSNFTLKQDGFASYTTIPNCFIEQFMPYAAGEFVKIYIYLLKCVGENRSELSISKIADAFNNTEKDVVRALKYWQRKGLLKLSFDEDNALTSLRIVSLQEREDSPEEVEDGKVTLNVVNAPVPGQPGINVKHGSRSREAEVLQAEEAPVLPELQPQPDSGEPDIRQEYTAPAKKEYTRSDILEFSDEEEIRQLFYIIQKYLGRPLTGQDTNTVLYLYDSLKFPADLIEYLFEYCVSKNHRSIRYIEKTALAWAESGIRTVEAAKLMAGIYSDDCYRVMQAFGLGSRRPTKNESAYVSRWTLSYGFDLGMILTACSKTMDQLHQPSFEYTDAILKNWKSHGVLNRDDVAALDSAFEKAGQNKGKRTTAGSVSPAAASSKFNNFHQRSYNFEELEKQLFNQ